MEQRTETRGRKRIEFPQDTMKRVESLVASGYNSTEIYMMLMKSGCYDFNYWTLNRRISELKNNDKRQKTPNTK